MVERSEYAQATLEESDLAASPIAQLHRWLEDARSADVIEPYAMCIATVDPAGRPSARIVLLRDLDERGLTFYTNYESRKGRELAENPAIAATFWWGTMERQVRVEGRVRRVAEDVSDAYFAGRPVKSRFAAAASPQSQVVRDRAELEGMFADLQTQYPDGDVPRPGNWGGYRILPTRFEFWQGRRARLHDRLVYERTDTGWKISRLAP